jgi:DNA-binding MarR family transcriptional regulator
VQNAHISILELMQGENVLKTARQLEFARLHEALIDVVSVMNRPQLDLKVIKKASVALDRALFPLLVVIDLRGPIGVVDLADRVGRDYSTVSRQVAKLEQLGLVERQSGADRRVRETKITKAGKAMTAALGVAREEVAEAALRSWDSADVTKLAELLRRFADALVDD